MNSKLADELREIATHRMDLQAKLVSAQVWQTCLNCVYWHRNNTSAGDEGCDKFNAMPPPHIVVNGCPDHENDIPF